MPQDKWSAITLCPYYRSHSEVGIFCEGPVTQSHLTLEFATRAQREHYQAETCACYLYRACPLALAAGRKYEQRERRRFNAAGQNNRHVYDCLFHFKSFRMLCSVQA